MKINRIIAFSIPGLLLAGINGGSVQAATLPVSSVEAATTQQAAADDLAKMIRIVTRKVNEGHPTGTQFMLAQGTAPTGPTTDMSEFTQWYFVFNTDDSHTIEVQASIDGEVRSISERPGHWGGVMPIGVSPKMSMQDAYALIQAAGYAKGFQFVSLVKPLIAEPHLQYHFENEFAGSGRGYAVNIDSGTVSPIFG
ncbi:hypothetical protein [Streptomyces kronopolitis]|uniref:hypothetical protein n=1 Tax=Streptomyces kronopolitis TaxID=1612435 RepID=UPI0036877237